MSGHDHNDQEDLVAVPPIVGQLAWEAALEEVRTREKAATRELDAIASARRRLPMMELPEYTLEGADGPVRLADVLILRVGETVYLTDNTQGRGTEQLSHTFALIDLLPYGRQEDWQDSPDGWPQSPTGSRWAPSEAFAQYAD